MKRVISYFCAALSASPLLALTEVEFDPKTTPEVALSISSPNRITFEGGEITNVRFDQNRFQAAIDEKTGEVFISPLAEIVIPSSITLRTSSGKSQTLNVTAQEGPGEVVYLCEKSHQTKTSTNQVLPLSTDFHSKTIELLNDILSYKEPKGYGPKELKNEQFPLTPPLESTPIYLYEGPFDTLLVLSVENRSNNRVLLDLATLKSPQERWVFCQKNCLKEREKMLMVICRDKETRGQKHGGN
ncbi:type-F conjugative transfer system secretin TraK [Simkania negevensis]|uniref:Conjugal transfer pore protein TraK n=1 Tax=Simkania negevensis (strain ATCC VR-1471 / DSM 27360 / Z) TaxID=331113 RepID=F8L2Z1_SIMNZ|nr:type-F conjugative transfer system secretin TraK [Simkania negevensis]CCB87837.1 conjugal transfer pore protein TraK [Simkania negevensis Z]